MKILLTAFEPFADDKTNSAEETLKKLKTDDLEGQIVTAILPTVYKKSSDLLHELIKNEKPDIILSLGQAGGRSAVTVERVAINIDDASIADNYGEKPTDRPIFCDGPAAYFSLLPIKKMVEKIKEAGVPAAISNTAGTFVCNHVMYSAHYYLDREKLSGKAGFIHLPYMPGQVLDKSNQPSMSLDDMCRAVRLALECLIEEYKN